MARLATSAFALTVLACPILSKDSYKQHECSLLENDFHVRRAAAGSAAAMTTSSSPPAVTRRDKSSS
ncbi:hypothetical protein BDZ97DRAFT_1921057 [Flammula alnicola]|nr:hypothetical protein BDZ97DRAFT_1921057 [Flammula alnicola]